MVNINHWCKQEHGYCGCGCMMKHRNDKSELSCPDMLHENKIHTISSWNRPTKWSMVFSPIILGARSWGLDQLDQRPFQVSWFVSRTKRTMISHAGFPGVNGHFRNLNWRYLRHPTPIWGPIFEGISLPKMVSKMVRTRTFAYWILKFPTTVSPAEVATCRFQSK